MPPKNRLPHWFRADDPWLPARMRQIAELEAGEARLGQAVTEAIGEFLTAARQAVLGPEPTVIVAAGVDPPPPDFSQWPGETLWQRIIERVVYPVISGLFGERFRSQTAQADIADYPYRQSYLAEVWSRLRLWPAEAWDDIQPELAEGIAEGEDTRQLRERVGEALAITARSRRVQAEINQLSKTIADPASRASVRREARRRRSALYRSKDREDQRWWFYAARIARTETVGALNAGTYYSAKAHEETTGEGKFKQWWCLTPENAVTAAGVTWVARRAYDGPVVRVTTEAGHVMTLTPHHPVLTPGGWQAAGDCTRGARLLRLAGGEDGKPIGDIAEQCLASAAEHGFTRHVARVVDGHSTERVQVCPPDPYLIAHIAPGPDEPLAQLARHNANDGLELIAEDVPAPGEARPRHGHPGGPGALAIETVTEVQLGHYAGPVYDFTTVSGFFAGPGGLLVHNSTSDNRVRPSHWAAHMQVAALGDKFLVGGFPLNHPGDPTGPPHEVINCRCSLLTMGRDEADAERERYEQFKGNRTDVHGRFLDDDGQPVTAAAATPSGAHMADTLVADTDPAAADAAAAAEPASPPSEEPGEAAAAQDCWSGVLAPLGVRSGDNRMLADPDDGLEAREFPLPLLYQAELKGGHEGAVVVGSIDEAWIDDGTLYGRGRFDTGDETAREVVRKIGEGFHRWVSVDLDAAKTDFAYYRGEEEVTPPEADELGNRPRFAESGEADEVVRVEVARRWRLMSATLVSQPAFQEATIALEAAPEAVTADAEASGDGAASGEAAGIVESGVLDDGDGEWDEATLMQLAEQVNDALGGDSFAITGDTDLPIADRNRPWDSAGASKRLAAWARGSDGKIDGAKFARAHLYRDPTGNPAAQGSYKLPFADVIGGRLTIVPRGVFAAAAAVQGSRGGVQLAAGDADGVKRKLASLYARIRSKEGDESVHPPWQGGADRSRSRIDWSKPDTAGRKPRRTRRFDDEDEDEGDRESRSGLREGQKVTVPGKRGAPDQTGTIVDLDEDDGTAEVRLDGLDRTVEVRVSELRPAGRRSQAALTAAAESWAHRVAEVAAELYEPPAEFFENPNLLRPTNPTVAANGRVFGHIHDWTTSHIGFPGRTVRAPSSGSGYAYFNLKPVRCNDGSYVRCGALVLGAHHAESTASANQATDHYDHSGFRVARIRVGADKHGTWFSGALVPGVTPEQVLDIAELTCSGDWRDGELRAALLVNVPGLPIVEGDETAPAALIAAGALMRSEGELGIADFDDEAQVTPVPSAEEIARAVVAEQKAMAARESAVARLARHVHAPQVLTLANRVYMGKR